MVCDLTARGSASHRADSRSGRGTDSAGHSGCSGRTTTAFPSDLTGARPFDTCAAARCSGIGPTAGIRDGINTIEDTDERHGGGDDDLNAPTCNRPRRTSAAAGSGCDLADIVEHAAGDFAGERVRRLRRVVGSW